MRSPMARRCSSTNPSTSPNILSLASILILPFIAQAAFAANVTWDGGGGDGLWTTATNWSGDVLPAGTDTVTLSSTTDIHLNQYFSVSSGGSLTLAAGTTLVIDGGLNNRAGGTVTNRGTITNLGAFNNYGTLNQEGGAFDNSQGQFLNYKGTINHVSGSISIDKNGILDINQGTLNINGTFTHQAGNYIVFSGGGGSYINVNSGSNLNIGGGYFVVRGVTLDNEVGGTINIASGGNLALEYSTRNYGTIQSSGRIIASSVLYNLEGATLNGGRIEITCSGALSDQGQLSSDVNLLDCYWDGEAGDGLWSNPRNWSTNTIPYDGRTFRIEPGAPATIHFDHGLQVRGSLSIGTNARLIIDSGKYFTIGNGGTVQNAGTIDNYGNIINAGAIANSGIINKQCQSTVSGSGTVTGNLIVDVCGDLPPVLTVPGTIEIDSPAPEGTVVTFSATAEDAVDGTITPTCTPASGSVFPVGVTTVYCHATDSNNGRTTAQFGVVVRHTSPEDDTAAPVMQSITIETPGQRRTEAFPFTDITFGGSTPATFTFSVAATDDLDTAVDTACTPASGSTIQPGETQVTCTATDNAGNFSEHSFRLCLQELGTSTNRCGLIARQGQTFRWGLVEGFWPYILVEPGATLQISSDQRLNAQVRIDNYGTIQNDGTLWVEVVGGFNSYCGSAVLGSGGGALVMKPGCRWDGGGDGTSWSDSRNWANDRRPGNHDAVTIVDADDVVVDTNFAIDRWSRIEIRNSSVTIGTTTTLTNNGGKIEIVRGALYNSGTIDSQANSLIEVSDNGRLGNTGLLENAGLVTVISTAEFRNSVGGVINNNANIEVTGHLVNDSAINNAAGAVIRGATTPTVKDSQEITNNESGRIINYGAVVNGAGGVFVNKGNIDNNSGGVIDIREGVMFDNEFGNVNSLKGKWERNYDRVNLIMSSDPTSSIQAWDWPETWNADIFPTGYEHVRIRSQVNVQANNVAGWPVGCGGEPLTGKPALGTIRVLPGDHSLEIHPSAVFEVDGNCMFNEGRVDNFGRITVKHDGQFWNTFYGKLYNFGEIVVEGRLNAVGPSRIENQASDSRTGTLTIKPGTHHYGVLRLDGSTFVNYGNFRNEGTIDAMCDFCDGTQIQIMSGSFVNTGEIAVGSAMGFSELYVHSRFENLGTTMLGSNDSEPVSICGVTYSGNRRGVLRIGTDRGPLVNNCSSCDETQPNLHLIKGEIVNEGTIENRSPASIFASTEGTITNRGSILTPDTHANIATVGNEGVIANYGLFQTCVSGDGRITVYDSQYPVTDCDPTPSLTLLAFVVNDNGGTATAADWTLTATGYDPASPAPGTYDLTASGPAGYVVTATLCTNTGNTLVQSVTLAPGEDVTCKYHFDDRAPRLSLVNNVTNDDGGTAAAADWTLTAADYDPASPVTGTYNLSQAGPEGYTLDSLTCSNSGNNQVNSVTLGLGENVTCTFVNNDLASPREPVSTYRKYAYTNPGIAPGYSKVVYAECDDGDVATGGSTYISPSAGESLYNWPLSRYDSTLGKYVSYGWGGYFRNTHATATTSGYVYVVCLDTSESPRGMKVYRDYTRSAQSISPGYSKTVYGYCDEGDVAMGGSTYIAPGIGESLFDAPISQYDSSTAKYVPYAWGAYFRNNHSTSSTYGYVYFNCLDASNTPGTEIYRNYAYTNAGIPPGYSKAVYAYCEQGDVAIGGSAYISPSYGKALYDWPLSRYDSAQGKHITIGWAAYFRNTHATATTHGYVYLACADNTP